MDKDGSVTFKEWNTGMVKHPIYGFGLLKNVEVFQNPGIAYIKNRAVNSGETYTGLPCAEVYDIYGNTYTFEGETGASIGTVYKNGVSIQSGLSLPWDLKVYKDYLWISYSSVVSCYGPLSSAGAQFFGNVATGFSSSSSGVLLIGQDDFLYRGNGNYIAKIEVTSSGTVGVAPSLSTTGTALDLPDGQYITCLTEYGTKIVAGTTSSSTYSSRNSLPGARLYSWNRQAGTLGNPGLADLPVIFNENGINTIIQHANKLYVSAGQRGNVYVTDATNYLKIATLPYAINSSNYGSTIHTNSISISSEGTLLIGVSGTESSETNPGIYEIDINQSKYPVSYRIPSSSTDGNQTKIGFIKQKDFQTLRVGWQDGSTYGVDTTDFRTFNNYGGVIETELRKVGGFNTKKTFQHIEWSLAEPLITGQNIRISYRTNNRSAWKEIGTWGYSTVGAVLSFEDTAAITDAQYIQLKIELDQALTTLYGYNINLVSVKLW